MRKTVQSMPVVSNRRINNEHFVLELLSEVPLLDIVPGQFANILADQAQQVFLRRPFSVYAVDYKCNTASFLIKAIGAGSRSIVETKVGASLNVIFPLGNGFSVPDKTTSVLLVGGGVGIAPLLMQLIRLTELGHKVEVLLGARRAEDLIEIELFRELAIVHTTTEDGSSGTRGFVTHHPTMTEHLSNFQAVYTCGPDPMMKAVAIMAEKNGVYCEASLENMMACGFGVCLCCVTATTEGNKCVCTEGPVFDTKRLKWQN